MSVVVRVEIGGEVTRYTFARTFMIGTYPSCEIRVHDVRVPYTAAIFVLPDRATFGAGSRVVPAMLDGHRVDLEHGRRHRLSPGNVLVVPGATITIEQVPCGPPMFDHESAAEFDRDMNELIANEPPPRPRIDSFSLSMDQIARAHPWDPARFASQPPRSLGDLEAALGLQFPADLYVHGALSTSRGHRPTDHAVALVSASLITSTLSLATGFVEDVRHHWLERYRVHFTNGRARWESAFATSFGAPHVASDGRTQYRVYGPFLVDAADGDELALEWYYKRPDWAVPYDAELRARWLTELAAVIARCTRREELVAQLGNAPPLAGIRVTDQRYSLSIELAPTVAAPELVLALGTPNLAWRRADGEDDVPYILVNSLEERAGAPRIGRWRVECRLDGHFPNGPALPHDRYVRAVTMTDRIRYLSIEY